MQILRIPIIFLLITIFSFLNTTNSSHENSKMMDHCLIQVCSYDDPISRYVQFPFVIKNDSMPRFCGYPGFDLICNGNDKLLINLPNKLGSFSIEEIDYINQVLWLNDLDNCLPRKLLSINGSSFEGNNSPFKPMIEQDYWFYNCSDDFFNSSNNQNIRIIGCLSGTSYGVFASPTERIKGNSSLCNKIGPIKVPIGPNNGDYSSNIKSDIRLTWSQPNECAKCYEKNGRCKFKTNSNLEVECFNMPHHGLTKQAIIAIALAFATPLILVTFCMLYFITKAVSQRRGLVSATLALPEPVEPQPETGGVQGLNRDIIESYPKVVLGESRRLPKADDMNCPICLGDYMPNESLRIIPDCGHCFHADCIDEWLQLNASCPVCRNSPNKTIENND